MTKPLNCVFSSFYLQNSIFTDNKHSVRSTFRSSTQDCNQHRAAAHYCCHIARTTKIFVRIRSWLALLVFFFGAEIFILRWMCASSSWQFSKFKLAAHLTWEYFYSGLSSILTFKMWYQCGQSNRYITFFLWIFQ